MVDNRGINPVNGVFKADNSSANKMSEEKQGQGAEYFAQEMSEEENKQLQTNPFQDRTQALRASLDSLAMMNAGSVNFKKAEDKKKNSKDNINDKDEEETDEYLFDE